jgi:hypothetical protein
MGNKIIIQNKDQEYICKDIWKTIFEYLDPEDLMRCSLVCKHFYRLNKNNELWFRKIVQKKIPAIKGFDDKIYYRNMDYKRLYISLFHHKFELGLHLPYVKLKSDYKKFVKYCEEEKIKNTILFFCVYVPIQIIMFPVYCVLEVGEYIHCKRKTKSYCNCKKCFRKQLLVIRNIEDN